MLQKTDERNDTHEEKNAFQQLLNSYDYEIPKKGDFTEATILSKRTIQYW